MSRRQSSVGENFSGADLLLIFAVSVVISWVFYHPYYFGDELTTFFRNEANRTFISEYIALNTYKPRLVFNALWALYGTLNSPRYLPMLVNASSLAGGASLLYSIAIKRFGASRAIAMLLAGTLLTSRFGSMLYFDYLSGNIEALSLLFFLAALYYALDTSDENAGCPQQLVPIFAFSCLCVFVHERYIVAVFFLGLFIIVNGLLVAKQDRRRLLIYGAATALLPGIAFFVAGKILDSAPISTGTAGKTVSIGLGTASSFLTYLANILLGTNFGSSWFVGLLNTSTAPGIYLIPSLAITFSCLWIILLVGIKPPNTAWLKELLIPGVMFALTFVASLPGPSKQESRWMFPVAALLGLWVISFNRRKVGHALLMTTLLGNVIYYATGSYKSIFNIQSSTTAARFGDIYRIIRPPRAPGVIMDSPEPQTSWWLGGDTILGNDASSGLVFCRVNFGIDAPCIYPPKALDNGRFAYAFRYHLDEQGFPTFTYVDNSELATIEAIRSAADSGPRTSNRISITATPSTIYTCSSNEGGSDVAVQWLVKDPHHSTVTVWLVPKEGAPALFATGSMVGSVNTGKWVRSPLSFVLTDSRSKEVLAVTSVASKPCERQQGLNVISK